MKPQQQCTSGQNVYVNIDMAWRAVNTPQTLALLSLADHDEDCVADLHQVTDGSCGCQGVAGQGYVPH